MARKNKYSPKLQTVSHKETRNFRQYTEGTNLSDKWPFTVLTIKDNNMLTNEVIDKTNLILNKVNLKNPTRNT